MIEEKRGKRREEEKQIFTILYHLNHKVSLSDQDRFRKNALAMVACPDNLVKVEMRQVEVELCFKSRRVPICDTPRTPVRVHLPRPKSPTLFDARDLEPN